MTLKAETKIGLTMGQIISIIGLLLTMIGGYVKLQTNIAVLNVNDKSQNERMDRHEQSNKEDLRTIVLDVKESLKEIKQDIKEIKAKQ